MSPQSPLPNLREIVPSVNDYGLNQAARDLLAAGVGNVVAIETFSRRILGELQIGDGSGPTARLHVIPDGLSPGSGGEVFIPNLLIIPEL